MRKKIALCIMWLLGVKSKFVDSEYHENWYQEQSKTLQIRNNEIYDLELSIKEYKLINSNLLNDVEQFRSKYTLEVTKNDKLSKDLKDILEIEETKPVVKQEIEYVTVGLKCKPIKVELTINTDEYNQNPLQSLNEFLIQLLPYIFTGKEIEGTNTKILHELTILSDK